MHKDYGAKLKLNGITAGDLKHYKSPTYVNLIKAAIDYADGLIFGSPEIHPELLSYVKESGKPILDYQPMESYIDSYSDFYDEFLVNEPATIE